MKKTEKKMLAALLTAVMTFSFFPILGMQTVYAADKIPASGNCGEFTGDDFSNNATFTYDSGTGALTISGTGEVGSGAFSSYSNKNSVKSIVIGKGITTISPSAFEGLTEATSVSLPAGLTLIGKMAFYNCFKLKQVTLPEGLEEIDSQAFFNDGISTVEIPASMKKLNWDAFAAADTDHGNITKVIMHSTNIEFTEPDPAIKSKIPNTIKTAGPIGGNYDYEFAWTEKIPAQAFAYLKPTGNNTALESVVLPATIKEIGASAFSRASNLTAISLPDSLTTIGEFAFYETGLTNVSLPVSVNRIGKESFNSCSSLNKITILNPACDIFDDFNDGKAIMNGATIAGYVGSTAKAFAEKHAVARGFTFESLGTTPIWLVDIGNVWINLDNIHEATFTGEINPNEDGLTDLIELSDEIWTGSKGTVIRRSDDHKGKFTTDETFSYSAVINAKGDNVFDPDVGFRFVYGGTEYSKDNISVIYSSDNKSVTISGFLTEQTVAAVEHVEGVAATSTTNGNREYWKVTKDGQTKYYSDESLTTEISLKDTVIPATGQGGGTQEQVTPAAAPPEIQDLPAVKISKPQAGKKKVTVKWKKPSKKALKKIQGIEIHVVGTDKDITTTAGKKKTSKKVGGLTSKQKYTVQVRAYANIGGVKHVSAWKSKTVKVK